MDKITLILIIATIFFFVVFCYKKNNNNIITKIYNTQSDKPRTFDNVVLFGDSLSDNGNLYSRSFGLLPRDPPYYKGRFSNNEVWSDKLSELLYPNKSLRDLKFSNYAVGGEVINLHLGKYLPWNLQESIYSYLYDYYHKNYSFKQSPKTLFIVWIGGNDYLNGANDENGSYTNNVVESLISDIDRLIYHGSEQILVANLPDLSKTPYSRELKNTSNVEELVKSHNKKLKAGLDTLSNNNKNVKIIYFDVRPIFEELINNTKSFNEKYDTDITDINSHCWDGGYTEYKKHINNINTENKMKGFADLLPDISEALNVTNAYKAGYKPCNNPDNFIYWDKVHPTKAIHSVLGRVINDFILENF